MQKKIGPFQILSDLFWTAGSIALFYLIVNIGLASKAVPTFCVVVLALWLFGTAARLDHVTGPGALGTAVSQISRETLLLAGLTVVGSPLYWHSIPVFGVHAAYWGHFAGAAVLFLMVAKEWRKGQELGASGWLVLLGFGAFGALDAVVGMARAL
jgi:hypothetical protein